MSKRTQFYLITGLLLGFTALPFSSAPGKTTDQRTKSIYVSVQENLIKPAKETDSGPVKTILRIESGSLSGDTIIYEYHQWGHPLYDPEMKVGNQFTGQLTMGPDGGIERFQLGQKRKDYKLVILFLITTLAVFSLGGWEGLAGLISTLLSLGIVLYIFFPLTFISNYLIFLGILVCVATIVITVSLVMRLGEPTIPAIVSLLITLGLTYLVSILGLDFLKLNATQARHSRLVVTQINQIGGLQLENLGEIVSTGIVLGTLGAMMDVGVVITSTIHEIVRDSDDTSLIETFNSGMRVGREILSTMVNTLVFAYMSILLPIVLSFIAFEVSAIRFVNYSFFGIEFLRICVGLIGLSAVIPISSFLGSIWFLRS